MGDEAARISIGGASSVGFSNRFSNVSPLLSASK
jgi:hypothetical protein